MLPSTRTPEGESNRCPICGARVCLETSWPLCDAPCPRCGHLLFFESDSQNKGRAAAQGIMAPLLAKAFEELAQAERTRELQAAELAAQWPLAPADDSAGPAAPGQPGVTAGWACAFEEATAEEDVIELKAVVQPPVEAAGRKWSVADYFIWTWLWSAGIVAAWIYALDDSIVLALMWFAAMCCYGRLVPHILAWTQRQGSEEGWRGILKIIVGFWGLLVGPLLGSTIGGLTAPLTDRSWTAWQGAWFGFVVGSLESMLLMANVLSLVWACLQLHTQWNLRRGLS